MIELMVVVIIIGILAAFAIPQYLTSVENSKASSGSSLLKMVGAANRMYAIDHSGLYVSGIIATSCGADTTCKGDASTPCELIACKYLPSQDYDNMSYQVAAAGNGTSPGACLLGISGSGSNLVACALRATSGTSATAPGSAYCGWGYTMDVNGTVTPYGGAPTPAQ
jgi:type II secretory pathway pseudopilin PulG